MRPSWPASRGRTRKQRPRSSDGSSAGCSGSAFTILGDRRRRRGRRPGGAAPAWRHAARLRLASGKRRGLAADHHPEPGHRCDSGAPADRAIAPDDLLVLSRAGLRARPGRAWPSVHDDVGRLPRRAHRPPRRAAHARWCSRACGDSALVRSRNGKRSRSAPPRPGSAPRSDGSARHYELSAHPRRPPPVDTKSPTRSTQRRRPIMFPNTPTTTPSPRRKTRSVDPPVSWRGSTTIATSASRSLWRRHHGCRRFQHGLGLQRPRDRAEPAVQSPSPEAAPSTPRPTSSTPEGDPAAPHP